MKVSSILKVAALAIPLLLASCHSKKTVVEEPKPMSQDAIEQVAFIGKVKDNSQDAMFVTSKLKFTVEYGVQKISLTGNLKMHRNDVIRLQLMAFGFVEAARLEFTPDYVLILDRINKQYLKAPYNYVDFLRNSGINFNTLQALFWNELFAPGKQEVDSTMFSKYTTVFGQEEDVVINYEQEQNSKMAYSWLANSKSGRIRMANIAYRDNLKGNTQLNWDYQEFAKLGKKMFPNLMGITLTTPEKEIKLDLRLNYLGNESDWEPRTKVSDKYREVDVDEILRRFMAL
jgi:hypothetical protein